MLKERDDFLRKLIMLVDACLISIAYAATCYIEKLSLSGAGYYLWPLFVIVPVWVHVFTYLGVYKSSRIRKISGVLWLISKGSVLVNLFFISMAYIFRITYLGRRFLVIFSILSLFLLVLEKITIMGFSRYIRRSGLNYRRILIVGTGPRAENFISRVNKNPQWGLRIARVIDNDPARLNTKVGGIEVTGLLDNMPEIIHEEIIDEVVYIVPRSWLDKIEKSIIQCELEGVRTHIAMDLYDLKIAKGIFTDMEGLPLVSFNTVSVKQVEIFLKRFFDIAISVLVLIISSPLFLLIAAVVKITSPGPVLFKQGRVGLHGRRFIMLKFRSMIVGAERLKERLETLNEASGPVFKIKEDPRLTPIGGFLRRTSLDELPQLINVLKGEMSIVGPRPPLPEEIEQYDDWQRRKLSVRPGITCLWQVNGRSDLSFEKWMELDLEYIDNCSLALDLKILLKTIPAVLSRKGAQ